MVKCMGRETSSVVAVGGQEVFELYYPGDDLGAVYSKESTTFRVFAPTALGVSVALYSSTEATVADAIEMAPDCDGTWRATVPGDLEGVCYTYRVDLGGVVNEAVDRGMAALSIRARSIRTRARPRASLHPGTHSIPALRTCHWSRDP